LHGFGRDQAVGGAGGGIGGLQRCLYLVRHKDKRGGGHDQNEDEKGDKFFIHEGLLA
jgi:hypothetical protein